MLEKIRAKLKDYARVLKTARRPTKEEFLRYFKMILFATFTVGLIGMVITLAMGWL